MYALKSLIRPMPTQGNGYLRVLGVILGHIADLQGRSFKFQNISTLYWLLTLQSYNLDCEGPLVC